MGERGLNRTVLRLVQVAGYFKEVEFLDQLRTCRILKEDCASWSLVISPFVWKEGRKLRRALVKTSGLRGKTLKLTSRIQRRIADNRPLYPVCVHLSVCPHYRIYAVGSTA